MLGKETRMDLKLLKNFFYIFVHLLLWNRPITSNIWVKLTKNTHDYYFIRHVIFAYCWNKCLGLIICLGFLLFYLIYNRKYMFSSQIHQVVGVLFLGLSVILKKKIISNNWLSIIVWNRLSLCSKHIKETPIPKKARFLFCYFNLIKRT